MSNPDFEKIQKLYYRGELSTSDLENHHRSALPSILDHVKSNSTFYHEILETFPRDTDLEELPFTTKAHLQQHGYELLSKPISEARVYYETTGTTGTPTPCPRSWLDVETSNVPVVQAWKNILESAIDTNETPVVALMGPSELYAFGDTFTEVANELQIAHVKLWPESNRVGYKKALRLLHDLRANVVVCAPALALSLAKAARNHGWNYADFNIRAFLVLGEVCTSAMADNIKSLWSAETYNVLYGSQECHAVATGCSAGKLHITEPNYILELLDSQNNPLEHGSAQTGELTITMLVPGSKPLIRFQTGDQATISDKRCDCGLPGRTIAIHGRMKDKIRVGDELWWPGEIETLVLHGLDGIYGYTIHIDERRNSVEIELDIDSSMTDIDRCSNIIANNFQPHNIVPNVFMADDMDPLNNAGSYIGWKAARIRRSGETHSNDNKFTDIAHRYETTT